MRGFLAGGLVRRNRIHVVYFSQAYTSPPLQSNESHIVLIIQVTCYCEMHREETSNNALYVHLLMDYIAGTHFLPVYFIVLETIEFHQHVTAEST